MHGNGMSFAGKETTLFRERNSNAFKRFYFEGTKRQCVETKYYFKETKYYTEGLKT